MLDLQIENTELRIANLVLQSRLMQAEHDKLAEKLAALQAEKAAQSQPEVIHDVVPGVE